MRKQFDLSYVGGIDWEATEEMSVFELDFVFDLLRKRNEEEKEKIQEDIGKN